MMNLQKYGILVLGILLFTISAYAGEMTKQSGGI